MYAGIWQKSIELPRKLRTYEKSAYLIDMTSNKQYRHSSKLCHDVTLVRK